MRYATAFVMLAALARTGRADEPAAWKLVQQGNAALASGKVDEAIQAYEQADALRPDSPRIHYNQGLAHYRKGDFAKARDWFSQALSTRDLELEADAHFNLGNCAYSQALAKRRNVDEAIELATEAIGSYRRTLELMPDDRDAKANIETARLLIKQLKDEKKKQQEQQKNQPQSQPSSQPSSRPKQQDQEKDPSKQDPSKKQDSDQKEQQQDEQKPPQDQKKQDEQQKQQGQDQQDKQDQAGRDEQKKQGQQAQQDPAKQGQLSRDEAERLLQAIRDKERQRRRAKVKRQAVIRVPVERDW